MTKILNFALDHTNVLVAFSLGLLTTMGVVSTMEKSLTYTVIFLATLYLSVPFSMLIMAMTKRLNIGNFSQVIIISTCILCGIFAAGAFYGIPQAFGFDSVSALFRFPFNGSLADSFISVLIFTVEGLVSFFVQEWAYHRL